MRGAVKERVTRGEVVRVGSVRRGRTRAPRRRLAQVAGDGGAGDWRVTPNSAAIWATVCLPSASHSSYMCELGLTRSELGLLAAAAAAAGDLDEPVHGPFGH